MSLEDPKAVSKYSAEGVLHFGWSGKGKDIWGGSANIPPNFWGRCRCGVEILPSLSGAGKAEAGLGLVLSPKMKVIMLVSLLLHPRLSTGVLSHFPSIKAVSLLTSDDPEWRSHPGAKPPESPQQFDVTA